MRTGFARVALVVIAILQLAGCGSGTQRGSWALPAADLSGTRDAAGSSIDARNVHRLRVRWRFVLSSVGSASGTYASTPVVDANTVYVEDLRSNVFALDRDTGKLEWAHHYSVRNDGPNGLAVDGGRVYGATRDEVFALAALNGRELWRRRLASAREAVIDVAPLPWQGLLFVSTTGHTPGAHGAMYALDAATGKVRWRFDTTARPRAYPQLAVGGRAWYPASVDAQGRLYLGTANATPWGDSLVVLDAATGRLLWRARATAHDARHDDFAATPVLAGDTVVAAGKGGRVLAWSTATRRRLWERALGLHENDVAPLPARRAAVCPGLFGGVETPIAYADGRLFVPVADFCAGGAPRAGGGRLVALSSESGRILWQRQLAAPDFGCAAVANDVVFTSTYDGGVDGFDTHSGALLWRARLPAGIDACPAVAGKTLFVGAGVPLRAHDRPELVAFSLTR